MRSGALCIIIILVILPAGCKPSRKPVTVFAAASLARALSDLEERVELDHPALDVQLEISGSQVACRKVAELNRRADVVATADYRVIDSILKPGHASYTVRFAANAVVLAHAQHSRHTETITADNWHEVLLRPRVRLGRVDPDLAPIGYRTRLVWGLARRHLGGKAPADLARRLEGKCAAEHVVPHEGELLQLLQTRSIDYAFLYRSTAEEHNLKTVDLPAAYNLGSPDKDKAYAAASVTVSMRRGERQTVRGAAVVYGLTIPKNAPNPAGARTFVEALLSDEGRRCLARTGFSPLSPARSADRAKLPAWLRKRVR